MNQDVFKNKSHPGESAPTVVNGRNAQVMPEKQPEPDVSKKVQTPADVPNECLSKSV